jgi:hypothetical protein
MEANEDELELACCMKNTWRVERGMAGSGKKKQIFYIGKSLVPVGNTNRD